MEIERRFTVSGLEVRQHKGKPRLEGLAIPFGVMSEDIGFRETIAPGAFSKHLRSDPDVRAYVEHDASQIIGRTRAGTLTLEARDDGVHVSIDPPDSARGNDLVESVRRGDLSGMSIGFRVIEDSWETTRDGESHRTVHEAELLETSVVSNPSYPETTIALRSLDRWQKASEKMDPETATKTETKPELIETTEAESSQAEERSVPAEPVVKSLMSSPLQDDPMQWKDQRTGKEIRVLRRDQKFADLHRDQPEPLSLGRAIRAMIIGDWSGAEAEQRAMSTSANPTAGFMIPNPLAANVIDLARNASVLIQAGAQTVVMEASTLDIARVATDATIEVHQENVALTERDVVFDRVTLTAFTLATEVVLSRELAADAPNIVQIIEQTIAAKLAQRIDFYGIQGDGNQAPTGLINQSGVNTTSVGTLDYTFLLTALKEVEIDNYHPNAIVLSPTSWTILRVLLVASEANHYAVAPPAIAALTPFSTNNIPDTAGVIGNFTKYIVGLRQAPVIELTTEGGDAWSKHQVRVKISWRGDFALANPTAFTVLDSI